MDIYHVEIYEHHSEILVKATTPAMVTTVFVVMSTWKFAISQRTRADLIQLFCKVWVTATCTTHKHY